MKEHCFLNPVVKLLLCFSLFLGQIKLYSANDEILDNNSASAATNKSLEKELSDLRKAILENSFYAKDRYQLLRQSMGPDQVIEDSQAQIQDLTEQSPRALNQYDQLAQNIRLEIYEGDKKVSSERITYKSQEIQTNSDSVTSFKLQLQNTSFHEFYVSPEKISFNRDYIFWLERLPDSEKIRLFYIDLKFAPIGLYNLPVFEIPLPANIDIRTAKLEFSKEGLQLGEQHLSRTSLEHWNHFEKTNFSMQANLMDLKGLSNKLPLIESFIDIFFELLLKQAHKDESSSSFLNPMKEMLEEREKEAKQLFKEKSIEKQLLDKSNPTKISKTEIDAYLRELTSSNEKDFESFLNSRKFSEQIESIQKERNLQKSLKAKISQLYFSLSVPRPDGATSIKSSFLQMASNLKIGQHKEFNEAFYNLYANKKLKISAAMFAIATTATLFPEASSHFLLQSLEIGEFVFNSTLGHIKDLSSLMWTATKDTLSGLNPLTVHTTYIADGRYTKTLTGIGALFGMISAIVMIPHITINVFKLAKDLKNNEELYADDKKTKTNFLKKFSNAFIQRQNAEKQKYYENLSLATENKKDTQADNRGPRFSLKDTKRAEKYIELARKRDFPQKKFLSFAKKMDKNSNTNKVLSPNNDAAPEDSSGVKKIDRLFHATVHFLFSFSAFNNLGILYSTIWNNWFIARTLVTRPTLLAWLSLHPRLFKVSIIARGGKIHSPNRYNSGLEFGLPFYRKLRFLFDNESFLKLEKLEANIIDNEANIEKRLLLHNIQKTVLFSKDIKTFESFNENSVDHISDKAILKLNRKSRLYFQWYQHYSMEKLDQLYLNFLANQNKIDLQNLSPYQQKLNIAKNVDEQFFEISEKQLSDWLDEIFADEELEKKVKQKVDLSWTNLKNFYFSGIQKANHAMNPKYSGQFKRYAIVIEKLKDPKAVARAMRSSMVKLIIDKPMELLFLMVLTAGIQGDLVQPIHDQMHSENSWFYLSKYQFLVGYGYGIIAGLLNNAWMKLQEDNRLDETGAFEKAPGPKWKKKGFWTYYAHNTRDKDNTLWQNQKYFAKLVWHNMGAALVTMSLFQWAFLGRIDLDIIVAGYMVSFFSPLSGIGYKLENAFEKSIPWIVRNIPAKYHSHPKVIQYQHSVANMKRLRYNSIYSVYENITGSIMSNFTNMSTKEFGPRSFIRITFGGFTATELLINKLDTLAESHDFMKKPAQACRSVLLNNYTAGIKLKNPRVK